MPRVAAVILAAGESSRFGKSKQVLKLYHKSLIRRIVDEAQKAGCSPVVVITGNARDAVENELTGTEAVSIDNQNWKQGIGTSISTGVQHLIEIAPEIEAAVLLVCDQPHVDAKIIRDLIALRQTTQKTIIASRYAKTLGVPALFDRSCFDELLGLDGDSGAKAVILSDQKRVAELEFPKGAIDIDTAEDWKNIDGQNLA